MTEAAAGDTTQPWEFLGGNTKLEMVCIDGKLLVPGDRVRLRPKGGADAFDLLLDGRTAAIEGIEQDYEERIYLAVVVDDDPGKEFGMQRKPGHRFFYSPDEVETIQGSPSDMETATPDRLVDGEVGLS